MNDKERSLLQHTLGDKSCYRNYYLTSADSPDCKVLDGLVERGLMTKRSAPEFVCGDTYYYATDEGKRLAWSGGEG